MAGFLRRNWDIILGYTIPLLAIFMTFLALQICTAGWGCLGLIFIALAGICLLFFITAAIRSFFLDKPTLRVIAIIIGLLATGIPIGLALIKEAV